MKNKKIVIVGLVIFLVVLVALGNINRLTQTSDVSTPGTKELLAAQIQEQQTITQTLEPYGGTNGIVCEQPSKGSEYGGIAGSESNVPNETTVDQDLTKYYGMLTATGVCGTYWYIAGWWFNTSEMMKLPSESIMYGISPYAITRGGEGIQLRAQPGVIPGTDPIIQPGTQPDIDPVTGPVTDPVTDPGTQPVTDPGTQPVTDPVIPGTDPVIPGIQPTDPGTQPGADSEPVIPGTDLVTDPVIPEAQPGTQPVMPEAQPGADPGTQPGADPGTQPGADPGTQPGADPGTDMPVVPVPETTSIVLVTFGILTFVVLTKIKK